MARAKESNSLPGVTGIPDQWTGVALADERSPEVRVGERLVVVGLACELLQGVTLARLTPFEPLDHLGCQPGRPELTDGDVPEEALRLVQCGTAAQAPEGQVLVELFHEEGGRQVGDLPEAQDERSGPGQDERPAEAEHP